MTKQSGWHLGFDLSRTVVESNVILLQRRPPPSPSQLHYKTKSTTELRRLQAPNLTAILKVMSGQCLRQSFLNTGLWPSTLESIRIIFGSDFTSLKTHLLKMRYRYLYFQKHPSNSHEQIIFENH